MVFGGQLNSNSANLLEDRQSSVSYNVFNNYVPSSSKYTKNAI